MLAACLMEWAKSDASAEQMALARGEGGKSWQDMVVSTHPNVRQVAKLEYNKAKHSTGDVFVFRNTY